ncbi:hypothetical protein [Aurantimonas sp. VKM B-3413]|uniref:GT-D fold domain-containing protein n=1 Tax=Aurantimonas sp. VKM B-3413 TaxID=2779401 RepID=UPI001E2A0AC6|nr:hypothetical protein [Aurantimonas sp. VKM B-3413]MCB8835932.1 hypothetical protein [Aurantimonas sp. VKM B-3413]
MLEAAVDAAIGARFDGRGLFADFLSRCASRQPAGLVRLGDGEGCLIGYPKYVASNLLRAQLGRWFGAREFSEQEIMRLRSDVISAVRDATHLCLPTPSRLSPSDGKLTKDAGLVRALWQTLLDEGIVRPEIVIGEASLHLWIQRQRKLAELFRQNHHFVFITRSAAAVANIVGAFGLRDYEEHIVPAETWSRKEPVSTHYPGRYNEIRERLTNLPSYSLGIVGAGILAKVYVADMMRAGSAAVDVGSLFDGWANDIPAARKMLAADGERLTAAYLAKEE